MIYVAVHSSVGEQSVQMQSRIIFEDMEHIDFGKVWEKTAEGPESVNEYITGFVREMTAGEMLTAEEAATVVPSKISSFFATDVGKRAAKAEICHKERPFTAEHVISPQSSPVLVQGVIDCYFEEDGELVLIDYKTNTNVEGIRETYREQIDLYKEALQMLEGKTVKEAYLYLFAKGRFIAMVIGHYIFASREMTMESRFDIFRRFFKKMLTLIDTSNKDPLTFFNNAASLNHIYRFISGYIFSCGEIKIRDNSKVAFFPGTFDPFSLSHKGIVTTIRDLGYDVYLALDEFSWSKKTQPRMPGMRRLLIRSNYGIW